MPGGWRPGQLPNIPQHTGWPPRKELLGPECWLSLSVWGLCPGPSPCSSSPPSRNAPRVLASSGTGFSAQWSSHVWTAGTAPLIPTSSMSPQRAAHPRPSVGGGSPWLWQPQWPRSQTVSFQPWLWPHLTVSWSGHVTTPGGLSHLYRGAGYGSCLPGCVGEHSRHWTCVSPKPVAVGALRLASYTPGGLPGVADLRAPVGLGSENIPLAWSVYWIALKIPAILRAETCDSVHFSNGISMPGLGGSPRSAEYTMSFPPWVFLPGGAQ